jgi:D-3-phosphoglycerate dehydrogenase / 2-oxoglutarate reductase
VGLGAIGQRFARMCNAMDMKVIGFDPFAKDLPGYIEQTDLGTIWRESDMISLHCPLTLENREMINAATLASCKQGVVLVNTARGGLVDEAALLDAVKSGQVAAAGLDSFFSEPLPVPHPLRGVANIILSPHIGGVTENAYVNMGMGAATNVLQVLHASDALS